ncbi:MAG: hypothetical protein Q8O46_00910 [bacterium]|nr:hypothetical protein [bacterium]
MSQSDFLNALRKNLENKRSILIIIFLSDEQSNLPVGGYACISKAIPAYTCFPSCLIYNGHMFKEDQNPKGHLKSQIKDASSLPAPYNPEGLYSNFHNRTNKLVTALYMVTDIMDKDEPLRTKLRSLGTSIVSDMYIVSSNIGKKIDEILSFLCIAFSVNMISSMNHGILKKEFEELRQSIEESKHKSIFFSNGDTMSEFLKDEENFDRKNPSLVGQNAKGHKYTRIGVQKGSTLMKALSRVEVSDRIMTMSDTNSSKNNYDIKIERREEILKIIKNKDDDSLQSFNGLTITDIRNLSAGVLRTCSEKTLQRGLVAMVKDGVLKKTGDKRWSRYFLTSDPNPTLIS